MRYTKDFEKCSALLRDHFSKIDRVPSQRASFCPSAQQTRVQSDQTKTQVVPVKDGKKKKECGKGHC